MVPITEQLADGYVALVKELNWNRVAVVSYDEELYLRVCFASNQVELNCYWLFALHALCNIMQYNYKLHSICLVHVYNSLDHIRLHS